MRKEQKVTKVKILDKKKIRDIRGGGTGVYVRVDMFVTNDE